MSIHEIPQAELTTIIRELCTRRPEDLRELMEGESEFTSSKSEGIANAFSEAGRAWTMALYHVRFVARYGEVTETIFDGKYWQSPFPKEFERWVEMGAPGVSHAELKSYLAERPLVSSSEASSGTGT